VNGCAANTVLYVITGRVEGSDARAAAVASLSNRFADCHFVYPDRRRNSDNPWAVRPWRNPFHLFELLNLRSVSRWLARWVLFPSADTLFTRKLRKRLRRAIRSDLDSGRQVTVLLTAPPHATVMLAQQVKADAPQSRVIIDWQDLWSYDESYFLRAPKPYRERLLEIEQRAMEVADLNIATNENARRLMLQRHQLAPAKVAAIHHHYHAAGAGTEAGQNAGGQPAQGGCRIGFLGNLFKPPKVRGDKIFSLLDQLADSRDVSLQLIGDTTGRVDQAMRQLRNPCVQYHQRMPLQEAVHQLATMDLLLLTLEDLPNCKIIMHGKLPAYLSAGPPIVALVPDDSFVAALIRRTGSGFVLSDPEQWQAELGAIIDQALAGTLKNHRNTAEIERLDWRNLQNCWLQALVAQPDEAQL